MRKYRIKSYREHSHIVQHLVLGLFWVDCSSRHTSYDSAARILYLHVQERHGYPRVSETLTEQEILNGKS